MTDLPPTVTDAATPGAAPKAKTVDGIATAGQTPPKPDGA